MSYVDFGRYLTQQRVLRGMAQEEVAASTRIPIKVLMALESGQMERLPGRVFVLNYIRAYAEAIGLEPEEAVLRFEEVDATVLAEPPPPALERDRRRKAIRQGILFVLALAAVIALLAVVSGLRWWG